MCLIALAFKTDPRYPLVLAANRDEFYARPTAPARFWEDAPQVLAGRDLKAGGTWMGITTRGKIAAVTNYRDPASHKDHAPSRGELVSSYLRGNAEPEEFLDSLARNASRYNGFNLILGTAGTLYWYSNRGRGVGLLAPGIHGLSNHLLDTPWPKVTTAREALTRVLEHDEHMDTEALFSALTDHTVPADEDLPDTGVGLVRERMLAPVFITSPDYGTRSSTILTVDTAGTALFTERTHDPLSRTHTTVTHTIPPGR